MFLFCRYACEECRYETHRGIDNKQKGLQNYVHIQQIIRQAEPKKPLVIIQDALGEFTLDPNQKYPEFEGCVNWCGEICNVYLEPDGDGVFTAERSLAVLHRLMEQAEDWDQRLKAYSAEEKLEEDGLVHIWGSPDQLNEDVPPITKEEYISRMLMGFLHVMADGNLYFDFCLDEMFTDHGEGIDAVIDGTICSAGLQG